MTERLHGWIGTGSGHTSITLELDDARASLAIHARWMGQPELALTFACRHRELGSHSGVLVIESTAVPLPPNPDGLALEYVRVPPQPDGDDDTYTMVLWLARDSYFDDGTELPADEYDDPPETWKPAVVALQWFESPWKLSPEDPA